MKKRSIISPASEASSPSELMVLRSGTAHFEPFNGSDVMLSIRGSVVERGGVDPHQAVLTIRLAGDCVLIRTITIPFDPEPL